MGFRKTPIFGKKQKGRTRRFAPTNLFSQSLSFFFHDLLFQFLEQRTGLVEFRAGLEFARFPVGQIANLSHMIPQNGMLAEGCARKGCQKE
jgi:hypothetical protein